MKTLVALYDDVGTARAVVSDLIDRGFDRDDISLVTRDFEANVDTVVDGTPADEMAEGAAIGAVSGGVLGGVTGLLAGLGALAIPGIGPIIAAGPILGALTGAGVGAATGGVLGALVGLDIPEEHVEYYAEGIRRGNTLVAVTVDENWVESAEEVIDRHYPINVERRSGYWRDAGWEGFNPESDVFTKEDYERNTNRFRAFDTRYYEYVPVFRSHFTETYGDTTFVYTDYEPVYYLGYRLATEDDYRDYDDWDGLEVEAREEWNEAESGLESTWDDIKDTVRHAWESVKDALDGDDEEDYNLAYDAAFRKHYMSAYRDRGNDYDYYEPAYRYGYDLANDERYDDINTWDELEAEAREGWNDVENAAGRAWDDIKDTVRHAWEFVTEPLDKDDTPTYFGGNGNGAVGSNGYGRYTADFRDHYNVNYAGSGNFFDFYEPGYRYGYYLATDDEYLDYDSWAALEAEARDEWNDAQNTAERAWEDIKDAARHAWEVVSEPFDDDDDNTY